MATQSLSDSDRSFTAHAAAAIISNILEVGVSTKAMDKRISDAQIAGDDN
jgi:hypothetical protein